jgi:oligosaccharide translocation protein RFT1
MSEDRHISNSKTRTALSPKSSDDHSTPHSHTSTLRTINEVKTDISNPSMTSSMSSTISIARSLVLLQLLTRILTFILNQSLVRLASPEVFGTAAIQFDLIYSTILFLSREGIRNALLRSQSQTTNIALARLPLKLGILVASLVVGVYIYSSEHITVSQEGFYVSLGLYVAAAWVELWVEPMYIQTIKEGKMRVRMQAEGGMAIVKALVTFGSLVLSPKQALLGFALGQMSGASWLAGRYVREYGLRSNNK